jgi:hypothetical protein
MSKVELAKAYDALQQADAAGNKEDAQQLADYIRTLEAQEAANQKADAEYLKQQATDDMVENPLTYGVAGAGAGLVAGPTLTKGVDMVTPAPLKPGATPIGAPPVTAPAAPAVGGYQSQHGFHPGATSNAQFNLQQAQANPLAKAGADLPGYHVPGNSRLILPTTIGESTTPVAPEPIPKKLTPKQKATMMMQSPKASPPNRVGQMYGAGMAAGQGADAINQAKQGNIGQAAISGIGSIGGAASMSSNPRLRLLGRAVTTAAPILRSMTAPEEKAAGGLTGYAAGKAVKGGLEAAKKLFDPRFDKRVLEQEKLLNQVLHTERTGPKDIPKIYLPDYEGYPVITSMSDRSAAGTRLKGINNVMFNQPVDLPGGQEFMYGDMAWASGINPVNQIMEEAVQLKKKTGKDPLYAPWRMAPTGSDFAHMTGETMLAYAQSAMGKSQKKDLNNLVKKFIPDWAGVDDPRSIQQFVSAPSKVRKSVQVAMDRDLRDAGSLGLGEARLAIADPAQINAPEGGLMHVAKIHADKPIIEVSGHASYPRGVPGEGLGQIEGDFMATQILPQMVKERGIKDVRNPSAQDIRALQMKPYSTIMDDKLLKALGFAEGGSTTPAWQRAEGKNPEGGLNAIGRASYNRETGGNLKAPQPEGGPRKKSFCARMEGMKRKNTSSATANDPD